jgi:glycosyltransferase involved in cell wall biosynthesis
MPDLSIVIFAYNEAENIGPVIAELRQWLLAHEPDTEIVLVDDGSNDGTSEAASQALVNFAGSVQRHPNNRGIGAALKTGVRAATGTWVTFLPADGQIPPSAIGTLRERARSEDRDLVLSVYDRRDDGWHRKVLSWGVRMLILLLHGVRLRSEGPYLFKRALFNAETLHSDSFFLNFEYPIQMLRQRHKISVVTIPCRQRRAGHSKSANTRQAWLVARDLVALRLRRWQSRPGSAKVTR